MQETFFVCSVERIAAYTDDYKAEKPAIVLGRRPAEDWPHRGEIKFQDLVVKYRQDLPAVLKGLNFTVAGGEKVIHCLGQLHFPREIMCNFSE